MIVYFNGNYIPKEEVAISPDDRGFLFGDGVYEVICAYSGRLFRSDAHLERLSRSLKALRIEEPRLEKLSDVARKLIVKNGLKDLDAKVYMQITRGAAVRDHAFPNDKTSPTVYAFASAFAIEESKWESGVKAICVPEMRWPRCDIKTVALLPNVLANQLAVEAGAEEALFVRDGFITEGAVSNFCAVFDGRVHTYPESHYILSGITRTVVLDLCRRLDIPVKEFPVAESRLKQADECMILGSTKEVMPVVQIDDMVIGDGKPGSITQRLQKAFKNEKLTAE